MKQSSPEFKAHLAEILEEFGDYALFIEDPGVYIVPPHVYEMLIDKAQRLDALENTEPVDEAEILSGIGEH